MVREVVNDDLNQLLYLYTFLHEKSIPELNNHLKSVWNNILNDNNYHLIVNVVDGIIVSSCTCIIIPNLTHNVRPYALIENVVTHKDYRAKGYASECLNYAKEIAIKNDCYKIMLMTGSKEQSTHDFYKKAGYTDKDKTPYIMWL